MIWNSKFIKKFLEINGISVDGELQLDDTIVGCLSAEIKPKNIKDNLHYKILIFGSTFFVSAVDSNNVEFAKEDYSEKWKEYSKKNSFSSSEPKELN